MEKYESGTIPSPFMIRHIHKKDLRLLSNEAVSSLRRMFTRADAGDPEVLTQNSGEKSSSCSAMLYSCGAEEGLFGSYQG